MVNNMKLLKFLSKISQVICFTLLLLFISLVLVSYRISKEKVVNPFCNNKYENININLEYKEINEYSYKFSCSTLYVYMNVNQSLTKEEILSLLLSISIDLSLDCYIHYEVNSDSLDKNLYASYNNNYKELSYVGG